MLLRKLFSRVEDLLWKSCISNISFDSYKKTARPVFSSLQGDSHIFQYNLLTVQLPLFKQLRLLTCLIEQKVFQEIHGYQIHPSLVAGRYQGECLLRQWTSYYKFNMLCLLARNASCTRVRSSCRTRAAVVYFEVVAEPRCTLYPM